MTEDFFSPSKGHRYRWFYVASAAISLVLLAILGFIWYRVETTLPPPLRGETVMTSEAQINDYLNHTAVPISGGVPTIYIPTGVVIQSLEFKGPYTLQVAGYVWQRFNDSLPKDLERGVVFPEADTTTFTQVYDFHQGNEQLVGWNFKTTLREQMDYIPYPFDRQVLWLRMWSKDFERNVYLMPDAQGYTTLEPTARSGLDPGVVLENWKIQEGYFSYRLNEYASTFGIQDYNPSDPQPELYYNILVERNLLSAVIARLLAPLIILIQLFVIVMVIGSDNKRLENFGVKPGAVIFTCAAFFFAVLVAQNALRDELKAYGIVYMETVFILTYIVILAVAANSVLLVAFPNASLFRDNDNLWVEVAYWPLILLVLLAVTLYVFR